MYSTLPTTSKHKDSRRGYKVRSVCRSILVLCLAYGLCVASLCLLSATWRLWSHRYTIFFNPNASLKGSMETYHFSMDSPRKRLKDRPSIIILSPIRQAMQNLNRYEDHVRGLTYPHNLTTIALLVGDGNDGTYEYVRQTLAPMLTQKYQFRRVLVIQHDVHSSVNVQSRHRLESERQRRVLLSRVRNTLLRTALRDEDFAVWLDHDLEYFPPTVIEELLETGQDCVIPVSLESPGGRTYDRNNWQETPQSIEHQKTLPEDFILYEGHEHDAPEYDTKRNYLRDLTTDVRNYDEIIRLDGVGSTILLVNAELHRNGLIFPEFPVQHQIESEGLARIAKEMGALCWGMPNLVTIHHQPNWPDIWRP